MPMNEAAPADGPQPAGGYARVAQLIATDRCVVLDGAIGTELIDVSGERPEVEEHLWGITALVEDPERGAGRAPPLRDAGCDVLSTNTWGLPDRGAPAGRAAGAGLAARCTGWTWRARACGWPAQAAEEGGRARRVRGGLQRQRRRRHARRTGDDPPLGAGVRGRPARPDPDGDAVAGPRLHLRDGRAPARDRATAVAELPPLPPRRLRGLRGALGRPGGRCLRPRRAALRGDGRLRPADQLRAARSCAGDGLLAAGLHRSAAGGLSQPGLPVGRRLALGDRDRRRRVRRAGAGVARGGRADRRRLLRRRPRARGRGTEAPGRTPSPDTKRRVELPAGEHEAGRDPERPRARSRGPTLAAGRSSRSTSRT